jgi:predicted membrane-bound spermidine synthase
LRISGADRNLPGAPMMGWFSLFFVISGFCGLLYELVWLRLSMAQFGVTSALTSIVLSAFMAGLGLGSFAAGRLSRRLRFAHPRWPLPLYAVTELLIGSSALLVPGELALGRRLLGDVATSSSFVYYLGTGAWLVLTLVPWSACMGATFPLAMAALRSRPIGDTRRSFSYLYVANVAGAVAGATLPLFLIELLGFRGTLKVGALLNGALAALVLALDAAIFSKTQVPVPAANANAAAAANANANAPDPTRAVPPREIQRGTLKLLFLSGLTSMGMEVVWIRQVTPYLGTVVYAFGLILAVYLAATLVGSRLYRVWSRGGRRAGPMLWSLLGLAALLPLLTANPSILRFAGSRWLRLVGGIGPASCLFGFVTPMLVDYRSGGDSNRAGAAYAVNVLGCIVGPLIAGFVLLPLVSARWALLLLALPWLAIGLLPDDSSSVRPGRRWLPLGTVGAAILLVATSRGFEDQFPQGTVLRDNTATVVAAFDQGHARLIVNGQGMTYLTPITKMMAHVPLALLDHPPTRGLVICFGMGTTYRSMLSWGISTTVVELVPSVPKVFGLFHPDGPRLFQSPLSRLIIDDGRRFLERTRESFDVIAIDPPPPVQAAGSSLLYSRELYETIRKRLAPGGILQQWLPEGDDVVQGAVLGALRESFRFLRVFRSLEGTGLHFLASDRPIAMRPVAALVRRMPAPAVRDMMEWGPAPTPERQMALIIDRLIATDASTRTGARAMEDDRPVNEYFLLRRLRHRMARFR